MNLAQPSQHPVSLIAIDDDRTSLELIAATLEQEGLQIFTASDPYEGLELFRSRQPQIVVCDLMMPGMDGIQLLSEAITINPAVDFILLTAHYSTESAVEAIQKGACDYFNKPISTNQLLARVNELIARARLSFRARLLDTELLQLYNFHGIVGRGPAMLDMFSRVERISRHFRTALLCGATGTGKELVARALHRISPAASGPFVVCNCAAIPENLVESELFGHIRGSFTGATTDKQGLFEAANNGVLLLDEIGEMPLLAQAKLLRVIQQQEVQRVGATAIRKVNVRIVAATHRNLREMVAEGLFREDLYYRVGMVEVQVPSLADRKEDLPLLFRHFIEHFSELYNRPLLGFTRKAEMILTRYSWPGNVRELEGVIASSAMMADSDLIDVADLPTQFQSGPPQSTQSASDIAISLGEAGKRHAKRVLEYVGGDKLRAAEILEVSRATLYRLIAEG